MDINSKPLSGKTAVVTGSSRGIGKAIALQLASDGADVVVHGHRHLDAAEAVVQQVATLGRKAIAISADVSDESSSHEFIARAWKWNHGVDIWINNAGADVLTGTAADWDFDQKLSRLWQVDVLGTLRLSRAIGKRMKSIGDGVILNMGWDQAWQGMEGDSGEMFATVKGAIMAFTKSLAKSLAPEVRVNCLAPGWIKTAWGEETSDYWQQRAVSESLMRRWGTAEDVAAAACYLASPGASFINGQIFPINGGFRSGSPPA